jgi:uncharacterized membrane protein
MSNRMQAAFLGFSLVGLRNCQAQSQVIEEGLYLPESGLGPEFTEAGRFWRQHQGPPAFGGPLSEFSGWGSAYLDRNTPILRHQGRTFA